MSEHHDISFTLNGKPVSATVDARLNLADFLRHTLRLTGTHVGCEHGVCGACNVLIDGRSVRSCLTLAVQADGVHVETVEGLTETKAIADLQREFVARNALQCGYCTPGMLITASELLSRGTPGRQEIREALSGNYCRCTGYQAIVDAVEAVALARAGAKP
jgi:carbon-monoxide dehydrogenase small subunit